MFALTYLLEQETSSFKLTARVQTVPFVILYVSLQFILPFNLNLARSSLLWHTEAML